MSVILLFLAVLPACASLAVPPLPSGNLDAAVDRTGTWSRKIEGRGGRYSGRSPPVVPLWVADMDFRSPQPIVDALVGRASNGVYGYTDCPPELEELMCSRLASVYGCAEASADWFRWLPGLLPGLNHAVKAACGDMADGAVAIPTPVYAPFLAAPLNCDRTLVRVPFAVNVEKGGGHEGGGQEGGAMRFTIDWDLLEATLREPTTRLLHFCNPHNPTGRCWTLDELVRVAELCVRHDCVLCSDEVWGELPLEPEEAPFTSMLALMRPSPGEPAAAVVTGLEERLIVLTSPSKCFNVAPLDIALAVIPDQELRSRFRAAGSDAAEVSCFGYSAAVAAYGDPECELWRQRLVAYLRANRDHAAARLRQLGIRCVTPEASYLMWMDCAEVLPAGGNAEEFFLEAGVALTGGVAFGGDAATARLNFGCRRETLDEGLARMEAAINAVASG